ncbi:MAG: AAA family ATPase [Anaerolineales bacterium]|nr:AAA family ATPase [Anaerolineales bacterium]
MWIKRVVIQGFKTFARRTEFVFDPGVTAVVGPNGSGKSNIVDAVRWCLGEQSFSLLRSRKTSDVIFSGSDKKARLNLVEVTITLDNSAGEIPIDYTEVEITRRLPRWRQRIYRQWAACALAGCRRPAGADRVGQAHLFCHRPGLDRPGAEYGAGGATLTL